MNYCLVDVNHIQNNFQHEDQYPRTAHFMERKPGVTCGLFPDVANTSILAILDRLGLTKVLIHRTCYKNSTITNGMFQSAKLQKGTLENGTLQNSTYVTKLYVAKRNIT
jgi:hypothetical protein